MTDKDLDAALLRNVRKALEQLKEERGIPLVLSEAIDDPWEWAKYDLSPEYAAEPTMPKSVWQVAMQSLVSIQAQHECEDIASLLKARCQSPVEELLFVAFLIYGQSMRLATSYPAYPRVANAGCCTAPHLSLPGHLLVCPQHAIGSVHVDFMVKCWEPAADYDQDGKVIGTIWPTAEILVEVDGHDFHDRTKEQASRDRKRDRELQKLGFRVYRYTGSDVWKNPIACAKEVIDAAFKIAIGA